MSFLGNVARRMHKHGFWGSLVRTNTGVSSLNFYLIGTTFIGMALLCLVIFAIAWEVVHNNIVSSDISGWAAFVGAVASLFASAGIAKGWSNWSENKYRGNGENPLENTDDMDETEFDPEVGEAVEETVVPMESPMPKRKRKPRKSRNKASVK